MWKIVLQLIATMIDLKLITRQIVFQPHIAISYIFIDKTYRVFLDLFSTQLAILNLLTMTISVN
jgi:hypothetical protein